jgi:hypothetical protein
MFTVFEERTAFIYMVDGISLVFRHEDGGNIFPETSAKSMSVHDVTFQSIPVFMVMAV